MIREKMTGTKLIKKQEKSLWIIKIQKYGKNL